MSLFEVFGELARHLVPLHKCVLLSSCSPAVDGVDRANHDGCGAARPVLDTHTVSHTSSSDVRIGAYSERELNKLKHEAEWHCTTSDAPGRNGSIKNMITDCVTGRCGKLERYDEISNKIKSMLIKVGWNNDSIDKNTPSLTASVWMGDNLPREPENMPSWKGTNVFVDVEEDTLYDVFDNVRVHFLLALMPMPIVASTRSSASVTCLLVVWSRTLKPGEVGSLAYTQRPILHWKSFAVECTSELNRPPEM